MKRFVTAIAGLAALAVSAEAQSFRCENGELVGGASDVTARCTANAAGQITSVTPYKSSTRETVEIYRGGDVRPEPVRTYTPTGNRQHYPAPLVPHNNAQPPVQRQTTYAYRQPASAVRTTIVSPNGNIYNQRGAPRTNVITASQFPIAQQANYAAPCRFKIRELAARGNTNVYEVCYSDIPSNDRRSMSKLYSRIKKASKRACGTDYDSVLTRWSRQNRICVNNSVDRAVMNSGLDSLRAYHLAKTGRGIPTVYVGDPRYSN